MDTEAGGVLVCVNRAALVAVPSEQGKCAACGSKIWIDRGNLAKVAELRLATICLECARSLMRGTDPELIWLEDGKEQAVESAARERWLRKLLGKNA